LFKTSSSEHTHVLLLRKPQVYVLGPMTTTFGVALSREGIVFGAAARWWRQEVEWCSSFTSAMLSLDGVVQRGLGEGRALMDSRRAGVPSSAIVASMANLLRGFI
jgi:hypothetical protein